jgi:chloramphenicol-sensitive protein RarD
VTRSSAEAPATGGPAGDIELRAGIVAAVSAYLVWGLLTVYWKLLQHFDAFDLIGWRVVSSAVVMGIWLTVTRSWRLLHPVLRSSALARRVTAASVLLIVNWSAYVWAIVNGHVIETALGYFMSPLGTIVVGVVVFGEQLRAAQRIAIALAVLAVAVLGASYGEVPWLALAIAVSWSLYGWLKKEVPLTPLASMSAESFVLLVPAIATLVVLAPADDSVVSSASAGDAVLVALSGLATVVPLMLFARAAPRVPLTILGPMQYTVPTINFLLGWLAYGEELPLPRLIGFSLVWAGLALVTVDALRAGSGARRRPPATTHAPVRPRDASGTVRRD